MSSEGCRLGPGVDLDDEPFAVARERPGVTEEASAEVTHR
jgi:hypothetical protein